MSIRCTLEQGAGSEADKAAVVDLMSRNAGAASGERRRRLEQAGIEIVEVGDDGEGRVSVEEVVEDLAERGFRSIFVEGGSGVITSFLRAGLVHRMVVVTAPVIIGRGVEAIGDLGIKELTEALHPRRSRVRRLGTDRVWELVFDGG